MHSLIVRPLFHNSTKSFKSTRSCPEPRFYVKRNKHQTVCSCVCPQGWQRTGGANVSTICCKLISLLPWSPSVEKYNWVTKGVRERKRARQTERGGDEVGNRGRLCMNMEVLLSPLARRDLSCLQWLMKTYGVCVSVCVCASVAQEGRHDGRRKWIFSFDK